MTTVFPQDSWVQSLIEKLNTDPTYARVAKEWEGDLLFVIEPDDVLEEPVLIYLDLWHGKCRGGEIVSGESERQAAFVLQAPFENFVRILKGEWQAMQAMLTRKLRVKGDMIYMMRNVPTVLEFVRCCQEVTTGVVGE